VTNTALIAGFLFPFPSCAAGGAKAADLLSPTSPSRYAVVEFKPMVRYSLISGAGGSGTTVVVVVVEGEWVGAGVRLRFLFRFTVDGGGGSRRLRAPIGERMLLRCSRIAVWAVGGIAGL